jgi:RNA polymerase sigma-70 factor, ECF subfamily
VHPHDWGAHTLVEVDRATKHDPMPPAARASSAARPRHTAEPDLSVGAADDALLSGAALGHRSSIEVLYGRYREGSIGVALSVLADPMEAEDVVQEVFEDLPRMARSYDSRRGPAPHWLLRSVRNRAIDHVRRRARHASHLAAPSTGSDGVLAATASAAPTPLDEAEAEDFLRLLGRLDPRHAHLIRLAFVDGWSHSAIAGMTGLPLGTVKTRIRLSLQLIRGLVAEADVTPIPITADEDDVEEGLVLVVSDERALVRAARRHAAGLGRVVQVASLPARAQAEPHAIVISCRTAGGMDRELQRVDALGWTTVPVVVHGPSDLEPPPDREAPTIILGAPGSGAFSVGAAVPAALSASKLPGPQRDATQRLIDGDAGGALTADPLGRITAVSRTAATFLGRSPRELVHKYVSELSAMPRDWSEHEWHRLATHGWWTGTTPIRQADGSAPPVRAAGWISDGGQIVGILAPIGS